MKAPVRVVCITLIAAAVLCPALVSPAQENQGFGAYLTLPGFHLKYWSPVPDSEPLPRPDMGFDARAMLYEMWYSRQGKYRLDTYALTDAFDDADPAALGWTTTEYRGDTYVLVGRVINTGGQETEYRHYPTLDGNMDTAGPVEVVLSSAEPVPDPGQAIAGLPFDPRVADEQALAWFSPGPDQAASGPPIYRESQDQAPETVQPVGTPTPGGLRYDLIDLVLGIGVRGYLTPGGTEPEPGELQETGTLLYRLVLFEPLPADQDLF